MIRVYWILVLTFFSSAEIRAQLCEGAVSNPIIVTSFGDGEPFYRGTLNQPTSYQYVVRTPLEGEFTIAKSTIGMNDGARGWHQIKEHTQETPNGYMMIVNGDKDYGGFVIYRDVEICPNTVYEFSAWIVNLSNFNGSKPNVSFTVETLSADILASYETNDIPQSTNGDWQQYKFKYNNVSQTKVVLRISMKNPRGEGNDIAIDDVLFATCGPINKVAIQDYGDTASLCEGITKSFKLTSTVGEWYEDPVYQWQFLNAGTWQDLSGENNLESTVIFNKGTPGTYHYRLTISERKNFPSSSCRTISKELVFIVNSNPKAANNSGANCEGGDIKLTSGDGILFHWTGPNNYTSDIQNPILTNVKLVDAGTYEVTVTNANNCTIVTATEVRVLPAVNPAINFSSVTICDQKSVQLEASGGLTYSWLPIEGLSNPNISNPIASPKTTTTYTVIIANGQCAEKREVTVNVQTGAMGNAGSDKKILLGQSISLNGTVSGKNVTYNWSPAMYLDDPMKLNPIATPPFDIIYTLNIHSDCSDITDDVAIKVYPKLDIPNTFTPNGDGVNDTWNIPAIATFDKAILKVVNRYGQLVYEGNGKIPWDGRHNGKSLAVGVYYYTLYINANFDTYTGWIMLSR